MHLCSHPFTYWMHWFHSYSNIGRIRDHIHSHIGFIEFTYIHNIKCIYNLGSHPFKKWIHLCSHPFTYWMHWFHIHFRYWMHPGSHSFTQWEHHCLHPFHILNALGSHIGCIRVQIHSHIGYSRVHIHSHIGYIDILDASGFSYIHILDGCGFTFIHTLEAPGSHSLTFGCIQVHIHSHIGCFYVHIHSPLGCIWVHNQVLKLLSYQNQTIFQNYKSQLNSFFAPCSWFHQIYSERFRLNFLDGTEWIEVILDEGPPYKHFKQYCLFFLFWVFRTWCSVWLWDGPPSGCDATTTTTTTERCWLWDDWQKWGPRRCTTVQCSGSSWTAIYCTINYHLLHILFTGKFILVDLVCHIKFCLLICYNELVYAWTFSK